LSNLIAEISKLIIIGHLQVKCRLSCGRESNALAMML